MIVYSLTQPIYDVERVVERRRMWSLALIFAMFTPWLTFGLLTIGSKTQRLAAVVSDELRAEIVGLGAVVLLVAVVRLGDVAFSFRK